LPVSSLMLLVAMVAIAARLLHGEIKGRHDDPVLRFFARTGLARAQPRGGTGETIDRWQASHFKPLETGSPSAHCDFYFLLRLPETGPALFQLIHATVTTVSTHGSIIRKGKHLA